MKSRFRYLAVLLSVLFSVPGLQSCLDTDAEDAVMEAAVGSYSTLATVVDSDEILVESDTYGLLSPVNKGDFVDYADSVGQRVLMEMNFVKENPVYANDSILPVKVLHLYKVLTKEADDVRQNASDSVNVDEVYGTDAIQVSAVSLSRSYLNVQFKVLGCDPNISHRISLLLTDDTVIDSEGLVRVELRHNRETDREEEPFWGVASFRLTSIPECDDPAFKGFKIVCNNGGVTQEVDVTESTPDGNTRAAVYVRPLLNPR